MAKYTVSYSCGHTMSVQLYGPTQERYRKIAYYEGGICPECFRVKKEQEPPIAHYRVCNSGVEINVVNSYAIKDTLKARGYRYNPTFVATRAGIVDFLARPTPAWQRIIAVVDGQAEAEAELMWLQNEMGARLRGHIMMEGIIASIAEGRPDLVPKGIAP